MTRLPRPLPLLLPLRWTGVQLPASLPPASGTGRWSGACARRRSASSRRSGTRAQGVDRQIETTTVPDLDAPRCCWDTLPPPSKVKWGDPDHPFLSPAVRWSPSPCSSIPAGTLWTRPMRSLRSVRTRTRSRARRRCGGCRGASSVLLRTCPLTSCTLEPCRGITSR